MKVEIWSDIVCPFCYIGKRQFEKALQQFDDNDKVEIEWKSFQLDPTTKHEPGKSIHQILAEKKGWTLDKAKQIANSITRSAKELGLDYNFDIAMHGNTFHAHRLTKLAARFALQNEMEERLFKAYFNEGKNIEDIATLFELGKEVGIPEQELKDLLETDAYSEAVLKDRQEAVELGIQGVPFFVFDQKYAVSGAQPATIFKEALQTAWKEHSGSESEVVTDNLHSESCSVSGNC